MLERIKSRFGNKIFSNIIHVNVKLKEAQNQGRHILVYDKYCRGAKDYYSLAKEMLTQEAVTRQPEAVTLEKKMAELVKEKLPKLTEITFSVLAPEARQVYLAGDFNGWKLDNASQMRQEEGAWRKRINLASGKYRYRFVIDGVWTEDMNNPAKEVNPYGSVDSLIEVSSKKK
jgi:hypothetical protein